MRAVLVAVLALLVGLGIGWMLRVPRSPAAEGAQPPRPSETSGESPLERRDVGGAAAPFPTASPRAEAGLISPELRRYALDEIAAGWREVRKDPIPETTRDRGFQQFEDLVKSAPRRIGRELAGHQNDLDALQSSDLLSVLRTLDKGQLGPQTELVRDADRFHSFFRCAGGETLDGPTALGASEPSIGAQATLTFGVGVFPVLDPISRMKQPPSCLTFEGAGMDRTLVVMGDLSTLLPVDRLAFRDCTVFTNGRYLFDLRSEPAVLAFDRVRFCGFDMGAGASCLLGARGTAVSAIQCRFEGGYGRSPTSGTLFDVRTDALLARFDGCTFSRLSLHPERLRPGATLVFVRCTFEELFDGEAELQRARNGVVFDQCSIRYADALDPNLPALDLNDLFPDWKNRSGR